MTVRLIKVPKQFRMAITAIAPIHNCITLLHTKNDELLKPRAIFGKVSTVPISLRSLGDPNPNSLGMFQNCTHPKLNSDRVAMAYAARQTQHHICRKAKARQGSLYCRSVCKCTTPQDHGRVFGVHYYETTLSFRRKPKASEISWTASQYGTLSYVILAHILLPSQYTSLMAGSVENWIS